MITERERVEPCMFQLSMRYRVKTLNIDVKCNLSLLHLRLPDREFIKIHAEIAKYQSMHPLFYYGILKPICISMADKGVISC